MLDYKPNIVLSIQDCKVVVTRPIRHTGPDKVTGSVRYGTGVPMTKMPMSPGRIMEPLWDTETSKGNGER